MIRLNVGDYVIATDDHMYDNESIENGDKPFTIKGKSYQIIGINIQDNDIYGNKYGDFMFEIVDENGNKHTFYYNELNNEKNSIFNTIKQYRLNKIKSLE